MHSQGQDSYNLSIGLRREIKTDKVERTWHGEHGELTGLLQMDPAPRLHLKSCKDQKTTSVSPGGRSERGWS